MTREQAIEVLITKANKGEFVESILNQIYDDFEAQIKAKDEEVERLRAFEEMIEWMEQNSNSSLCDYYNAEG